MSDYSDILNSIKISDRHKAQVQAVTEASIDRYESKFETEDTRRNSSNGKYINEARDVLNMQLEQSDTKSRYISFIQTLRSSLLTESLLHLYKQSTPVDFRTDTAADPIMRSIVSEFVNNVGYNNILSNMKHASSFMSEMYTMITETSSKILEEVDQADPGTFKITPEMKDDFFKQLNYNDSEAIEDAIHDRVTTSMQDFVTANTEDHDNVSDALQKAQEEIGDVDSKNPNATDEEKESIKEFYQMRAKRTVNEIRNAPKSVFHAMVSAMCEGVLKHPETNVEFMDEGHLDMDKIVSRTGLMYSFMEMLNTTRLHNIDEAFVTDILNGLKS